MKERLLIALSTMVLLFLLVPQTAMAEIDSVLGEIEWGDTKEEVIEKLRTEMMNQLREDSRLRNDRVAMQRERQRVLDRMRRIEDSYTSLRGSRTGFEVSVVSREFNPDNSESLMRVRDDVAQRYYFFHEGKLYKLVVAYDQNYVSNVGFDAFLNQASRRYGRPSSTEFGRVHGEEVQVEAVWQDGSNQLRVEDQREFYGTFTMAFSQLAKERELRALRDAGPEEGGVSDRVRALMGGSATDPNANIVDGMVGGVQVELPEGPQRAEEEEETEERAEGPSERPSTSSRSTEREDRPRTRRPSRQQETSSSDDDLVIY